MGSAKSYQMVGLLTTILLLIHTCFTTNAQPDVRGLSFENGFIRLTATADNPCYSSTAPYASNCELLSPGSISSTLNYWRRTYSRDLPLYVEAGLGLRYFPSRFESRTYIYQAGVPDTLLTQSVASYQIHSLFLHLPIEIGYQFNIKNLHLDVKGGMYFDLPLYGTENYHLTYTDFYFSEVVEDSAYHYLKLKKKLLDSPEVYTLYSSKSKGWEADLAEILGFSISLNATLPIKSQHTYRLGYHYERAINPIQFRRYRIEDSHSLFLSIGFNEKTKSWTQPSNELSPTKKYGFVLGVDYLFQTYEDGYTSNMSGLGLAFAFDNPSGFIPELRVGTVESWKGYENASESFLGIGIRYSKLLKGYLVPRAGLETAKYHNWNLDDSMGSISSVFAGAALQFPNSGYLRMEVSVLGYHWLENDSFQPLRLGCGMYYFFGQGK